MTGIDAAGCYLGDFREERAAEVEDAVKSLRFVDCPKAKFVSCAYHHKVVTYCRQAFQGVGKKLEVFLWYFKFHDVCACMWMNVFACFFVLLFFCVFAFFKCFSDFNLMFSW